MRFPFLAIFLACAAVSRAASYYVSTTGLDSAAGTLAVPWKTIHHALATVKSGDSIWVRAGIYHEQVLVRTSGQPQARLTLSAYPGERPVIDGTGLSAGDQSGLVDLSNVDYVTVQGFEIRNFRSNTSASVPIGLYIHGKGTGIRIVGNTIHDIATTVQDSSGNALGLAVYGSNPTAPIDGLVIADNTLYKLTLGFSESMAINGNVTNFLVSSNIVHDTNNIGIGCIGYEGTSSDPTTDRARGGMVTHNLVYNVSSLTNPAYKAASADGIYVDGGTRITIDGNFIHHCDIGLELASEHLNRTTSYCMARNNVIWLSTVCGVSLGGYDSLRGGTDTCTVVNNTLYQNDSSLSGTGEFQIQFHATGNRFYNNVVSANGQGLFVNSYVKGPSSVAAVNNLYWFSGPAANATWVWNGVAIQGLAAYRAASHGDAGAAFSDPLFLAPASRNFRIPLASPATGLGYPLPPSFVGSVDADRLPRIRGGVLDAGAYEHF